MTIAATVIADSISPQGIRLTTFQVRCHRFILPEVNTHRVFSRNWASSRAIPTAKLIEMVSKNPATPIHWGKNQSGMQAHEELDYGAMEQAKAHWWDAAQEAVKHAAWLNQVGAHKQIVNRVLEPYLWIPGVITATDYENFYALRRHEDAQPEIKALADAMWVAQQTSEPVELDPGEWHLPYINILDWVTAKEYCLKHSWERSKPEDILASVRKVSVARCARVSYLTHDGRQTTVEEDIALYERLMERAPLHATPAEHQATPDEMTEPTFYEPDPEYRNPEQHGNLRGWRQFRKMLPGEFVPG